LILDTSAVVAIANREPEHEQLLQKLQTADLVAVGAPTLAESSIVLMARFGAAGERWLLGLVEQGSIEVVPFDRAHWLLAAAAWRRFGRGRHGASLNFGDCLSYATAKHAAQPLLCVGNDFAHTDIALA
jgi:ribonuclease VapC